MILKKRNAQTARWDHDNNKWIVGTMEYQWTDTKNRPVSDWMNLDNALKWIIEHDNPRVSETTISL
jgi:hypothetical protein